MTTTTKTLPDLNYHTLLEGGYVTSGPWRSSYTITVSTIAVNLACFANTVEDYDVEVPVAIEKAVEHFESENVIDDGSIHGFWALVLSKLDQRAHAHVVELATEYLTEHRAGPFGGPRDLYERFDGQR